MSRDPIAKVLRPLETSFLIHEPVSSQDVSCPYIGARAPEEVVSVEVWERRIKAIHEVLQIE